MLCDYAILIVNSFSFRIAYKSEFKWDTADFFVKALLQIQDVNTQNILSIIDKRGHVEFYEDGNLYIMCKYWAFSCYNCGEPTMTYRVNSKDRLCQECAHEYLKEVLKNPSRKNISSKEDFIELMKAV